MDSFEKALLGTILMIVLGFAVCIGFIIHTDVKHPCIRYGGRNYTLKGIRPCLERQK